LEPKTADKFVETHQVAPTILEALGLNPHHFEAVPKQGTEVLPGVDFDSQ